MKSTLMEKQIQTSVLFNLLISHNFFYFSPIGTEIVSVKSYEAGACHWHTSPLS